jgi:hypothetical protein
MMRHQAFPSAIDMARYLLESFGSRLMPMRHMLEAMSDIEQPRLLEIIADNL